MTTVNVYEFRNKLADYLELVEASQDVVVVKKFQKPIAMLVPYTDQRTEYGTYFGFLGKSGKKGDAFLDSVRRSKKEARWAKRHG